MTGKLPIPTTREDFAKFALEVSTNVAAGYRRNISQFNLAHENDAAEKCATAASNTGYWMLIHLGFMPREIIAMAEAMKVSEHQTGVAAGDDGQPKADGPQQ
jgi:hypothetical protein